jgi:aminoglycoside 3-N-acetyltransferase
VLTKTEIVEALRRAGIQPGWNILVHSSMRSMGTVAGGPEDVVEAFLEVLGEEGTLMVPTFHYRIQDYYDPALTPSVTGLITETLRLDPRAVRSLQPTHSVAAIGRRAAEFVEGHERAGALRIGSPIDKLAKAGGYTVLLGVGHLSNSSVHVGESWARAPYLAVPYYPDLPPAVRVRRPDGEFIDVPLAVQPGCSRGFGAIEMPLRERGSIRDFKIGPAFCQLMKTQDIIDCTVAVLARRPDVLLCTDPGCYFCTHARPRCLG